VIVAIALAIGAIDVISNNIDNDSRNSSIVVVIAVMEGIAIVV